MTILIESDNVPHREFWMSYASYLVALALTIKVLPEAPDAF